MQELTNLRWHKAEAKQIAGYIEELQSEINRKFPWWWNTESKAHRDYIQSLKRLQMLYKVKLSTLNASISKTERRIESIEDWETREIAKMIFFDCMTFEAVGDIVGMDRTTVARTLKRYFSKQPS